MQRTGLFVILCSLGFLNAAADIVTREVSYSDGKTEMTGYLAYDDALEGKRPGVLVVHEWWGHNDYARSRAKQLAGMGYTALAVDMYGQGKTADHPKDAGAMSGAVMANLDQAKARFLAAKDLLESHETSDPERTVAIGYCFGGGVVLHMARLGVDLDGVVSFHGSLDTARPAGKGEVKARILVCNGADDAFVSADSIEAFKKEMDAAGATYTFKNYSGAVHSFTNPSATEYGRKFELPLQYNAAADKASWADMRAMLEEVFAPAATAQ